MRVNAYHGVTHVSLIFSGYDPYRGPKNLPFSWFWGPKVVGE